MSWCNPGIHVEDIKKTGCVHDSDCMIVLLCLQCMHLIATYEPLIRNELHWWVEKGITADLLDRSQDAKV